MTTLPKMAAAERRKCDSGQTMPAVDTMRRMRKPKLKPALVTTSAPDAEKAAPHDAAPPTPAERPAETMEQAQARVQRCFATIQQILQHHNCSIVPIIVTEQIGEGPHPSRMLVGANYYVRPNPL